jgi:rod shape-determining protein MreC
MEFLLQRFRNLTILVMVVVAQLLLLAYQVRTNQDVRLIRVWAVTAVTPLARLLEGLRSNTYGFLRDYVLLADARQENLRLKAELDRFKLENQFLKTELSTAERARALSVFQTRMQSKTLAARIIGTGTAANSKIVFVDRGSAAGVMKGMAVATADGIVGKVIAAYPTASQVMLITDANFAAGVISQNHRVHGTLKGQGQHGACLVDYVQNEEKVEVGELFYTSGEDRIFPKGLPAGVATVVRPGKNFNKEIFLTPSGFQRGLEEVLILIEGVHQALPDAQSQPSPNISMLPAPPPEPGLAPQPEGDRKASALQTDADRTRERYRRIGEAQGHVYGEGLPGSRPPDFNASPDKARPPVPPPAKPAEEPPARKP